MVRDLRGGTGPKHGRADQQTGTTPLRWLYRARVRRAQYLLESTRHPVDQIAAQAGLGSPTAFRERFRTVVGTSPQAYRRALQKTATTDR